jgi:hypothetical protein
VKLRITVRRGSGDMEDPVALAKAAVEGFIQDAETGLGTGNLDSLRGKFDGVIDQLVKRLGTEYQAGVAVLAITCWECHNCGWQLLDPQLDLAQAVCLCGTGAGRWSVSQTARALHAKAGTVGYLRAPDTSAGIRPLTAAESLPVLYPLPGTVKS